MTVREQAALFLGNVQIRLAGYCVLFGMSVSMLVSALLTLVKIPYLSDSYSDAAGMVYGRTDLLLVLILVGFLSPVIEEIIFRGYMLNRLLAYFGERVSVLMTAAVFALCHVNLIWTFYAFFMGIFLGRLAMRKDNILYSICVHIGFNLPSVLIAAVMPAVPGGSLFFGSKLLVLCYGLAGCVFGRFLWLDMRKEIGE